MVQAYNFLSSWQLFPEKGNYENGISPKSGTFKMDTVLNEKGIAITHNWVTVENDAFFSQYQIIPNNQKHPFDNKDFAETYIANVVNSYCFIIQFYGKQDELIIEVKKEILPNGYMQVSQIFTNANKVYTNIDIYHKQMSVLPYSSSVSGVAIRPTKEGVIKHKALTAMEEQTNMQLDQIRQQIELLARQAQELKKRKELSLMIYESKLNFKPQIGQKYHLYERENESHLLSLVGPKEWGAILPFKSYIGTVKLLADHTWVETVE